MSLAESLAIEGDGQWARLDVGVRAKVSLLYVPHMCCLSSAVLSKVYEFLCKP